MRENLLTDLDFIYPNSVLAVLLTDWQYSEAGNELTVKKKYGAISIIDGQHRCSPMPTRNSS
jgi:hypothetical protein